MKTKSEGFWLILVFSGMCIASDPNAGGDPNQFRLLPDYVSYAGSHNAEIAAAIQEWQAAQEEIPQAKALPNPRFEYQLETQRTPHGQTFGIMQPFPWFGTIKARTEAAVAGSRAAESRSRRQKYKTISELKQAYFEYSYLARQFETAKDNLELSKHFEEVTRIRYATSMANHPDHIRSEVEIARAQYEVQRLESQRDAVVARLNAILNRPIVAMLPWPGRQEFVVMVPTAEQIAAAVAANNPEISALDFDVVAARARIELAKKRFYPEFEAGVDAMYQSEATMGPGAEPVYAKVAVTLPIWTNSYAAGERQARANLRQAGQKRVQAINNVVAEAQKSLFDLQDAQRRVNLYKNTIIPRSQEMLASYEALYRSGGTDFLNLIDAQRTLLNARLEYERALSEEAQSAARIEELTGQSLGVFTLQGAGQ